MELAVGQTIGEYEILSVLGEGGMGKVYQVRHRISQRLEALKVLLPDLMAEPPLVGRFLREIRISASLAHPNIASMHTAQLVENQFIMIMEFVEGKTLDTLMNVGDVSIPKAIDYTCQVLVALSYAHSSGVIHRDIKPSNIMITRFGTVKLMDFGIAKGVTECKLTQTGLMIGSVYYMSPEQIEGKELDARTDLYSMGVTLYEVVTGQRPFNGDSAYEIQSAHLNATPHAPRELNPLLSAELNDVVMRALARDPTRRFQTADAFRRALSDCKTEPQQAKADPPTSPKFLRTSLRLCYVLAGPGATIAFLMAAIIQIPKYTHTRAAGKLSDNIERIGPMPTPIRVGEKSESATHLPAVRPPNSSASQVRTPFKAAHAQPLLHPWPSQTPIPKQSTTPPNTAELSGLRERRNLISLRIVAVRNSIQNLERQLATSGLGLRADIAQADQNMRYYFNEAELSLNQGDAVTTNKRLDTALGDLEKLERLLGR